MDDLAKFDQRAAVYQWQAYKSTLHGVISPALNPQNYAIPDFA
jgi:hypothetical protein